MIFIHYSIYFEQKTRNLQLALRHLRFTIYDSFRTRRDFIFIISVPVATGLERECRCHSERSEESDFQRNVQKSSTF